MEKQWYVVHTYAGYENKVKTNLEKRVESMNMEENIFRIVVPMEDEIQVKDGKRKVVPRKIFPGYVLVEMCLTDTSWYVVRNTPGVTGFVGSGSKPVPLAPEEAERILLHMGYGEQQLKVDLAIGQEVRVMEGPFEGFVGNIDEIYPDKGKIRVSISMFGRETPVELDYYQVEKVTE